MLFHSDELGARVAEVALHERQGFFANGDDALFIAFPDATDAAGGAVDIHNAKADEFGDPEAGRIENLEHCAVAQAPGRLFVRARKELFDLFEAQITR